MKDEPAEAAPKPIPSVARDASYLTRSANGSKAPLWLPAGHFRSSPMNRHPQCRPACPKGANLGSTPRCGKQRNYSRVQSDRRGTRRI